MASRKHFLLLLLFIPVSLFAQNPFSKKADSLYQAKVYLPAGRLYILSAAAEPYRTLKTSNYYNAACCYALAGQRDSAIILLNTALANGYKNVAHTKVDTDLDTLHAMKEWAVLIRKMEKIQTSTKNPKQARFITTDIHNFWKAYDLVQKDTAHRADIYKKYYVDAGTDGLQDYFAYKVRSLKNFVTVHDRKPKFYAAIRKNTLAVDDQKPQMIANFVKFKELYPDGTFPDVYFVMGSFSSGGTSTGNGLLIGIDQSAKTPEIPLDELTLWQRNNFNNLKDLPGLIAHELIHFNQEGMKRDTTLLQGVMIEGSADFIGELISGHNSNERLHVWAKGKEKQVWADFKKEIYLNRGYNWIANSNQETADKPADLGYWVGYQIAKAYYDNSTDKKLAIKEILNIKDYKEFYAKSGVEKLYN
jgi:hypothetical protein